MRSAPLWKMALDSPPQIRVANVGRHGSEESWQAYRMHELWCIHWYDYHGRIEIGEWQGEIRPGMISVVSPGQTLVHRWSQKDSRHFFAHFQLAHESGNPQFMPAIVPSTDNGERELLEVVATGSAPGSLRGNAALWECLWRIATRHAHGQPETERDTLRRFERFIEHHLADPISLSAVAEAGGVSPNHANLLFKRSTGRTLCEHWRRRRMETASSLLQHTDLGIKQVANQCGYTDLQQFNKLMRKSLGQSPREIRRGSSAGSSPSRSG